MPKKFAKNQILYGPPGTGKTYHTINKALEIVGENVEGKSRTALKTLFESYVNKGQIVFTTFHQSMSYEDFIEGIKPVTTDSDTVIYEIKDGIFKQICVDAQMPNSDDFETVYRKLLDELYNLHENNLLELRTATGKTFAISVNSRENLKLYTGGNIRPAGTLTKEGIKKQLNGEAYYNYWLGYFDAVIKYLTDRFNFARNNGGNTKEKQNYVLIIDEINRGNVSQIFGELITLIEDDKRLGSDESLTVTLPYSKTKFGVPYNVHIIGTMNTADRSVEALDTALRRRFVFEEMPPKYDLDDLENEVFGIKKGEILKKINLRIEKLLDKDHLIGHAYFLNKTEETLVHSFYKNIIPLLQEYFFGDYAKIGLVLGKGFVREKRTEANIFADFDHDNKQDFEEKNSFEIIDYRLENTENDLENGFKNALIKLMC